MNIFKDMELLCGEGPVWEARRNRLLWVDSDSTYLYASELNGETVVLSDDIRVSSVALSKSGYVLLGDGMWLMDFEGKKQLCFDEILGERVFFNDSTVGPDGAVYAGTYYWDENGMKKKGKLYRISKKDGIDVLDDGICLSNGLGFSPDGKILYYSDSARKTIFQYDVNGAELRNKRIFAVTDEGIPDGLTVDSSGYVWCAAWYEGAVYRFDPDGKTERVMKVPAKQVSSVGFGGSDMNILFITSASGLFKSEMMPSTFLKEGYLGGKVYIEETDVTGISENISDF